MKIFELPYPKSESKREIFISSVLVGIAAYLFLLIFQPFGTNSFPFSKLLQILLPYPVIVVSVFYFVTIYFLNKADNWNLRKEILKIISIVFLCSVLGFFYNTLFINKVNIRFLNFLYMFLYTFSIAAPICSIYVLVRFIYLNGKNMKSASELSGKIRVKNEQLQEDVNDNQIKINDHIFNEKDLLFIESTDNYCTFHYQNNSRAEKVLIRTTLKFTLEQIRSKDILRCHRSFIVNLKKVKTIKGNAQGYKLSMEDTDLPVPVSRKYMEEVKSILNR